MESKESKLLLFYLFADLILLNIAIVISILLNPTVLHVGLTTMTIYVLHANLSWIMAYVFFSKKNLYLRDGYFNRFKRISIRTVLFVVIAEAVSVLFMLQTYIHVFLLQYAFLFYVEKLIFYWFFYNFLRLRRSKGFNTQRVMILGINETCQFLRNLIDKNAILGYKFVGYITSKKTAEPDIIGYPDELSNLIDKYDIQMLFVSLSLFGESNRGQEYLRICNQKGIKMRFIPDNQRWLRSRINMESLGSLALINPQEIPLDEFNSRFFKRLFDLIFSSLVIILIFSWLFPILGILIKLNSKGPVFFVQKRTGINNKTFNCYKFRSMQVNKDANNIQATTNDCRLTRIGKFMRRTNIDELPQFINVFLGHMSVTGPRPHMLKHTDYYKQLVESYLIRHYVKPGITGWAQVNGYRGETNELWKMEKRVECDLEYIENWSFWWDLDIIFRTIFSNKSYKNAG
jgi:putative colanic acid biosysnthesis UDP-glucose lipid carrier transferase